MGKIEKFTNSLRNQTGKEVKGMKKVLISLAISLVLVMAMAVPVMAAEEGQQAATVTVPSYITFTITDTTPGGLQFGSMTPGDTDKREADDDVRAVQLVVGAETNAIVNIQTKGDANFAISVDSGTATGADSSTVLIDSVQTDFGTTVTIGDTVINTTDGSTGTVATIVGETQVTLSAALTGGVDNTFQSGDSYVIRAASPDETFAIGNAHWDTDSDVAAYTAMTATYATVAGPTTPGSPESVDLWHWLSMPDGQAPGTYSAMFYYAANE